MVRRGGHGTVSSLRDKGVGEQNVRLPVHAWAGEGGEGEP